MGRLIFLMALFYLIQVYGSSPGLFYLPLMIYVKETLGLSAAKIEGLYGLVVLPWVIKPIWGVIADSFPILGYPMKGYFVICYTLAFSVFLGLSRVGTYTISILIGCIVAITTCIAFSDTIADKLMVVEGKPKKRTAVLQAAQWTAYGLGGAAMHLLSGWMAQHTTLSFAFFINAFVPLVGLVAILFVLKEKKVEKGTVSIGKSLRAFWSAAKSWRFLAIACFIAFLRFSPLPLNSSPILFYQRDVLQFEFKFLGILNAIETLGFGVGALIFGVFARKISRRLLLNMIIGFGAISTLALIFMSDHKSAILVYFFIGLTYMIATLGVFEIAAHACPTSAEGTTFALLLSINNLAGRPGAIFGGWLYDRGITFSILVIIAAVFTMLCWFLIPLLKLEREESFNARVSAV